MFRTLLFCISVVFTTASSGMANEWSFRYGPDLGGKPTDSFTKVASGSNSLLVYIHDASRRNIAVNVTLDTFDNGGAVLRSLNAGLPLKLDVLRQNDRYERMVPKTDYVWKDRPDEKTVTIVFLLTADDLFAMAEGRAMFLWAESLQFRFGLENAGAALRQLFAVLQQS